MDDEVFIEGPVHSHLTAFLTFYQDELFEHGFWSCHRLYYDVTLPIQNRIFYICKTNIHPRPNKLYCRPFRIIIWTRFAQFMFPFVLFPSSNLAFVLKNKYTFWIHILSLKNAWYKKNQENINQPNYLTQELFFFLWNTFHTQIPNPICIILNAIPIQFITTSISNT